MIEIKQVKTKNDFKSFVKLPFEIYKDNKYWVPYILDDELKSLKPQTNPAFENCEAEFWLAIKNNKVVGRIGAIINHSYNNKVDEKIGRFTRLEFFDDKEICKALIKTAENWLKQRGMTRVLGPLGFNNLDSQGLLVEGFDYLAAMGSVYHLPYYHKYIEELGYSKEIDWIEFRFRYDEIPEKGLRLKEVIEKRFKVKVLDLKTKEDLKPYIKKLFDLVNASFVELPFVSSFSEKMIDFYSKKYLGIIQPQFVKIVVNEFDDIVGFIISIPSVSKAMQKANGRMFPFGFIHLLRALRKPEEFELLLAGINPSLQGMGIPALIMTSLQSEFMKHQKPGWVETTGNFETNHKAYEHWKNYDYIQHKRKRCYQKSLV